MEAVVIFIVLGVIFTWLARTSDRMARCNTRINKPYTTYYWGKVMSG